MGEQGRELLPGQASKKREGQCAGGRACLPKQGSFFDVGTVLSLFQAGSSAIPRFKTVDGFDSAGL